MPAPHEHLIARLDIILQLDEPVAVRARLNQRNQFVFDARWPAANAHNAVNSSGEADLVKPFVRVKAGEDVAWKQSFYEVTRLRTELILVTMLTTRDENLDVQSPQIIFSPTLLIRVSVKHVPAKRGFCF